ncbi:MAG TPA: hypothetical protein VMF12_13030 [Xanthobacteraceae bacterium]|nr:hypothetical protein [Xanthobacteraceae bacterium]
MSAIDLSRSAAQPRPWPRFILVNHRLPRVQTQCALCGTKIERSYLRELGTGFIFCDPQCLAGHQRIIMRVRMAS